MNEARHLTTSMIDLALLLLDKTAVEQWWLFHEKGVLFVKKEFGKMADSLEDKILRRIRGKPLGWVFTSADFRDMGSDVGIRKALQTICDRGRIRRLARGLYDNPKTHPKLGELAPTAEQIVQAITTKDHTRVQPTGAYCRLALKRGH